MSRTAHFTAYTPSQFGHADHERLQRLVVTLAGRGCQVLLSNSTAGEIVALYEASATARAAGLKALRARRGAPSIENAAGRGPVDEYLITNIETC